MEIPIPNHDFWDFFKTLPTWVIFIMNIYEHLMWPSPSPRKPKKTWLLKHALNFEDLDKAGKHGSTPLLLVLGVFLGVFESYGPHCFTNIIKSVVFPVRIIHQHQTAGFFHIRSPHRCLSVGKPNGHLGCLWVDIPICQGFCNKKIAVQRYLSPKMGV